MGKCRLISRRHANALFDLLKWLIFTEGMHAHSKDSVGRNVLETAKASRATSSTKWIVERQARRTIESLQRYHPCKPSIRKQEKLMCAALNLQKKYRDYSVREMYRGSLGERLEASQHFSIEWGHYISSRLDPDCAQLAFHSREGIGHQANGNSCTTIAVLKLLSTSSAKSWRANYN